MSAFDTDEFSESYPVAHLMVHRHRDSWFRIHSLPKSKRYADTEREWEILLSRHRQLADRVLGPSSPCRVHYSPFVDERFPSELEPSLDWSDARLLQIDDEETIYTRSAQATWSFDTFETWIRLRSDCELGSISFHSLATDAIYAPYDGGADVFLGSRTLVAEMKAEFSAWASKHPMGF